MQKPLCNDKKRSKLHLTMGYELRRVPADWQHPIDCSDGSYIPIHHEHYTTARRRYAANLKQWMAGKHKEQQKYPGLKLSAPEKLNEKEFEQWYMANPAKHKETFNPRHLKLEECEYFQMYETTTIGTPVSPVLTFDQLQQWLRANGWEKGNIDPIIANPRRMIYKEF